MWAILQPNKTRFPRSQGIHSFIQTVLSVPILGASAPGKPPPSQTAWDFPNRMFLVGRTRSRSLTGTRQFRTIQQSQQEDTDLLQKSQKPPLAEYGTTGRTCFATITCMWKRSPTNQSEYSTLPACHSRCSGKSCRPSSCLSPPPGHIAALGFGVASALTLPFLLHRRGQPLSVPKAA